MNVGVGSADRNARPLARWAMLPKPEGGYRRRKRRGLLQVFQGPGEEEVTNFYQEATWYQGGAMPVAGDRCSSCPIPRSPMWWLAGWFTQLNTPHHIGGRLAADNAEKELPLKRAVTTGHDLCPASLSTTAKKSTGWSRGTVPPAVGVQVTPAGVPAAFRGFRGYGAYGAAEMYLG